MSETTQTPGGVHDAADAHAGGGLAEFICLVAGWLLITLGFWGAFGRHWWIWAFSLGLGAIGLAVLLWWIDDRRLAVIARRAHRDQIDPEKHAGRQRPVPISSARGERPA